MVICLDSLDMFSSLGMWCIQWSKWWSKNPMVVKMVFFNKWIGSRLMRLYGGNLLGFFGYVWFAWNVMYSTTEFWRYSELKFQNQRHEQNKQTNWWSKLSFFNELVADYLNNLMVIYRDTWNLFRSLGILGDFGGHIREWISRFLKNIHQLVIGSLLECYISHLGSLIAYSLSIISWPHWDSESQSTVQQFKNSTRSNIQSQRNSFFQFVSIQFTAAATTTTTTTIK